MSNGVSSGDIDRPNLFVLALKRRQWRKIPVVEAPPEAPQYLVNLPSTKGHIWALARRPDGSWRRWHAPLASLQGLPQVFID